MPMIFIDFHFKKIFNKEIWEDFMNTMDNLDEAPIFKFINPNSNDKLLKLAGSKEELLRLLNHNFYLQLKNNLNLDKNISLGLEIEVEHSGIIQVKKQFFDNDVSDAWQVIHDWTLKDGVEIKSPILVSSEKNWQDLKRVCELLEPISLIDQRCGGHIHIGAHILKDNPEAWLNFIKLWSVYENIIFRFSYGDWLSARKSLLKYAKPMSIYFWSDYLKLKKENASLEQIISRLSRSKYQSVNFCNVKLDSAGLSLKNTIEFRCPNGTLIPEVWQNNVNFFASILNYCQSSSFDDDIVSKRYEDNKSNHLNLKTYDAINLEQALELSDMIFNVNLDKLYFLKQYLKSLEIYQKSKDVPKLCVLTKVTKSKNNMTH